MHRIGSLDPKSHFSWTNIRRIGFLDPRFDGFWGSENGFNFPRFGKTLFSKIYGSDFRCRKKLENNISHRTNDWGELFPKLLPIMCPSNFFQKFNLFCFHKGACFYSGWWSASRGGGAARFEFRPAPAQSREERVRERGHIDTYPSWHPSWDNASSRLTSRSARRFY